jgi:hypothetical protein
MKRSFWAIPLIVGVVSWPALGQTKMKRLGRARTAPRVQKPEPPQAPAEAAASADSTVETPVEVTPKPEQREHQLDLELSSDRSEDAYGGSVEAVATIDAGWDILLSGSVERSDLRSGHGPTSAGFGLGVAPDWMQVDPDDDEVPKALHFTWDVGALGAIGEDRFVGLELSAALKKHLTSTLFVGVETSIGPRLRNAGTGVAASLSPLLAVKLSDNHILGVQPGADLSRARGVMELGWSVELVYEYQECWRGGGAASAPVRPTQGPLTIGFILGMTLSAGCLDRRS